MARKPLDQLSPKYRARIERALAKGKTRQEARGHRRGEHIERKEKQLEEFGITAGQFTTIRNWYSRTYNPNGRNGVPDEDELVEYAMDIGYEWFKKFRKVWEAARRTYLRELRNGTWESRGLGHLTWLTDQASGPDMAWLYYH